ncbi:hypothetical protein HDV00_006944 [Rhizophlyctis rosea]|nr:hypothetical protein HDV00_006944 [Rhizophlyctis rosea]
MSQQEQEFQSIAKFLGLSLTSDTDPAYTDAYQPATMTAYNTSIYNQAAGYPMNAGMMYVAPQTVAQNGMAANYAGYNSTSAAMNRAAGLPSNMMMMNNNQSTLYNANMFAQNLAATGIYSHQQMLPNAAIPIAYQTNPAVASVVTNTQTQGTPTYQQANPLINPSTTFWPHPSSAQPFQPHLNMGRVDPHANPLINPTITDNMHVFHSSSPMGLRSDSYDGGVGGSMFGEGYGDLLTGGEAMKRFGMGIGMDAGAVGGGWGGDVSGGGVMGGGGVGVWPGSGRLDDWMFDGGLGMQQQPPSTTAHSFRIFDGASGNSTERNAEERDGGEVESGAVGGGGRGTGEIRSEASLGPIQSSPLDLEDSSGSTEKMMMTATEFEAGVRAHASRVDLCNAVVESGDITTTVPPAITLLSLERIWLDRRHFLFCIQTRITTLIMLDVTIDRDHAATTLAAAMPNLRKVVWGVVTLGGTNARGGWLASFFEKFKVSGKRSALAVISLPFSNLVTQPLWRTVLQLPALTHLSIYHSPYIHAQHYAELAKLIPHGRRLKRLNLMVEGPRPARINRERSGILDRTDLQALEEKVVHLTSEIVTWVSEGSEDLLDMDELA